MGQDSCLSRLGVLGARVLSSSRSLTSPTRMEVLRVGRVSGVPGNFGLGVALTPPVRRVTTTNGSLNSTPPRRRVSRGERVGGCPRQMSGRVGMVDGTERRTDWDPWFGTGVGVTRCLTEVKGSSLDTGTQPVPFSSPPDPMSGMDDSGVQTSGDTLLPDRTTKDGNFVVSGVAQFIKNLSTYLYTRPTV